MSRALAAGLALLGASCLKASAPEGLFACAPDGGCTSGRVCDDGVCCVPGGAPACPTTPHEGTCPGGVPLVMFFPDVDGDGYGADAGRLFCARPLTARWVSTGTDCDDDDPSVHPDATEACNGVDDNCNHDIDEGTPRTSYYLDTDSDGFGVDCPTCTLQACATPKGYAPNAGDCDPDAGDVFPGAVERCNNRDDNCDGQLDDPPFFDVEPSLDGGRFDCPTQRPGVCALGGLQCVFQPATGAFEPRCVARQAPSADSCDGLDNDCDGLVDDKPGCRGPSSLLSVAGARTGALRLVLADTAQPSRLPARCLRHTAGEAMSWLNPIWVGNGEERQVWFLEAPADGTWDLSSPGVALHLELANTSVGGPAGVAIWDAGWFLSPVVTLCGEDDAQLRRWVPTGATMLSSSRGFQQDFPVAGTPAGWTLETGSGSLDAVRVRGLEVVVSPVPSSLPGNPFTFRITFGGDAGFR